MTNNKKQNVTSKSRTSSTSNAKRRVARAGRKIVKRNIQGLLIAFVAIVLVLAIGIGIVYWQRPDVFWQGYDWVQNVFNPQPNEQNPLALGDGELQIHFIDVGQGDCILILLPDGKTMMIDAGNSSNSSTYLTSTLSYIEGYLSGGVIDYMMLTHADSDHCYYLDEIIDAYQVNTFFMPNILSTRPEENLPSESLALFTDIDTIDTVCYANFFNYALLEPNSQIVLNVGVIVIETETYRLTLYCPSAEYWNNTSLSNAEKRNAISPIVILEYNGFKVVLTGDSNSINEPLFMDAVGEPIDCDVLKVAHHGSPTSSTPEFLDFVTCEYGIISVGNNSYGHPAQDALDRFTAREMTIYRTDQNGTVVLSITTSISFSVEK